MSINLDEIKKHPTMAPGMAKKRAERREKLKKALYQLIRDHELSTHVDDQIFSAESSSIVMIGIMEFLIDYEVEARMYHGQDPEQAMLGGCTALAEFFTDLINLHPYQQMDNYRALSEQFKQNKQHDH